MERARVVEVLGVDQDGEVRRRVVRGEGPRGVVAPHVEIGRVVAHVDALDARHRRAGGAAGRIAVEEGDVAPLRPVVGWGCRLVYGRVRTGIGVRGIDAWVVLRGVGERCHDEARGRKWLAHGAHDGLVGVPVDRLAWRHVAHAGDACVPLQQAERRRALAGVHVIEADEHRHVRPHRLGRAGLVAGRAVRARVVVGVSLVSCYAVSVVSQRLLDDRDLARGLLSVGVDVAESDEFVARRVDRRVGRPGGGDALVVVAGRVVVLTGRAPAVGALHGREDRGRGAVPAVRVTRVGLIESEVGRRSESCDVEGLGEGVVLISLLPDAEVLRAEAVAADVVGDEVRRRLGGGPDIGEERRITAQLVVPVCADEELAHAVVFRLDKGDVGTCP